jgi:molybdopterin-biosynthesis enzyme MoeA-like protein
MKKQREVFYALIIGTEILNGRREDKHFKFLRDILKENNLKFGGSFIIDDTPEIIASTIGYISTLPNSVLFSFGGIGSTPDDYTRLAASKALRDGKLYANQEFEKLIIERLGDRAYPHPINMAKLPQGAKLLPNVVNKMPGFSLDDRFFFMPGFPEMSHPMVEYVINRYFKDKGQKEYRYTLTAHCRENEFIELMSQAPEGVEVSSLPKIYSDGSRATISVASLDKQKAKDEFEKYIKYLDSKKIQYGIGEE